MMRTAKEHHQELQTCNLETERRGITRRDVEELLDVSKNTALKYLNELEADGAVEQIGHAGQGVYYKLTKA